MARGLFRKSGSHKANPTMIALFAGGLALCMLSSFFTTIATPLLIILILGSVFFLSDLKETFVILFPITLINPELRFGAAGMVLQESRSFRPFNLNIAELLLAGIILAWLISGRDREGERAGKPMNVLLILLALLAIVAMFVGHPTSSAMKIGVEKLLEPLVLFFAITHIRWKRGRLERAATVFLAVSVVVALKSLHDWLLGPPPEPKVTEGGRTAVDTGRLTSFWGATNMVAGYFTLAIPLAFLRTFYLDKVQSRFSAFLAFGILALGMVFTQTRTAWIAAGLALLLLSLRFRRGWVLLGITIVATAFFGTTDMIERISSVLDMASDVSFRNRTVVWFDSLGMIAGSPIWGIGFGTFLATYRSPIENVHPHNDFLAYGVDMGILAPILLIFILLRVVATARRAMRLTNETREKMFLSGFLAAIGAIFLQSQMACLLNWWNFGLAYWYVLGITFAYARSIILDREVAVESPLDGRFARAQAVSNARSSSRTPAT